MEFSAESDFPQKKMYEKSAPDELGKIPQPV
jgi:hypothetical protein